MIVVYPMLTSASVSPNVLPGVIKAIEKYILLYNTDDILKHASRTSAGQVIANAGKMAVGIGTAAAINKALGSPVAGKFAGNVMKKAGQTGVGQAAQSAWKAGKWGTNLFQSVDNTLEPGSPLSEADDVVKPRDLKPTGPNVKPELMIPKVEAVSLEPTWVVVTTQRKGQQVLGVKVVPFQVKSPEPMLNLLMQDAQLKGLSMLATKYGRGITRVITRIAQKFGMQKGAISGEAKKDVIYGGTDYKKNIFVCLSKLDLEQEDITSNPAVVRKLQKLGWASFVILDDVNRKATFCMKEYGGVCSVVPYNFMFASLGKDHAKAYEDLEDLKKSSGPFFSMKTNRKRAFSEGKRSSKVDKYLELIQKEN